MLNGISLFSGVGGLELALHDEVKTVAYVEREAYCQAVLIKRMRDGHLDQAPIYDDVQTFNGKKYRGQVDIVFGGFPCQDISVAGKGKGIKEGTRSGLWFEMHRIIGEVRPPLVFLENVSAITRRGLDTVTASLAEAGYDCRWCDVRASDVGARHRRERWFCLAYTNHNSIGAETCDNGGLSKTQREVWGKCEGGQSDGCGALLEARTVEDSDSRGGSRETGTWKSDLRRIKGEESDDNINEASERPREEDVADDDGLRVEGTGSEQQTTRTSGKSKKVSDSCFERLQGSKETRNIKESGKDGNKQFTRQCGIWRVDPADINPASESFVGRVADGIPKRVDRLKCLGNAVVPQQGRLAWKILTNIK